MAGETLDRLIRRIRELPESGRGGRVAGRRFTFAIPTKITVSRWRHRHDAKDCHERFVLFVVLSGRGELLVEETGYSLVAGQAMLVFPYQVHHLQTVQEPPTPWLLVAFETANLDSMAALRDHPVTLSARAVERAGELCCEYGGQNGNDAETVNRVTVFLILLLMELVADAAADEAAAPGESRPRPRPTDDELFQKIERHINLNMHMPITIQDLAVEVGLSPSHLRAMFREHVGVSLGRFIRHRKVSHAAHLLDTTALRMKEITLKCGFRSPYNFSRCFRREMDMPPTAYRRRERKRRGAVQRQAAE